MILAIKSPKATQVANLHVDRVRRVTAGDLLIELHDYEEQKVVRQIDRAITENQTKIDEARSPLVQANLVEYRSIVGAKQAALRASEIALNGTRQEALVGSKTTIDILDAMLPVTSNTLQILKAQVEAELYLRNAEDALTVYSLVGELLASEKRYVEGSIARLRISAPRAGLWKPYVSTGTPVRLGHLLGEIE